MPRPSKQDTRLARERRRIARNKVQDREERAIPKVEKSVEKLSGKPTEASTVTARHDQDSPRADQSIQDQKKPFPWILLLVGCAFLVAQKPGLLLAWSSEPSPRWAQDGVILVGLNGVWWALRTVLALQFLEGSSVPQAERKTSFREYLEFLLSRTAACALCGTFLALIAMPTLGPSHLKATVVLADLATVGAVVGLSICGRKSVRVGGQAFKSLKEFDRKTWIMAVCAFRLADLVVYFQIYILLLDIYTYYRNLQG
jgi:hypothetical protein